jgi:hypothetical protein
MTEQVVSVEFAPNLANGIVTLRLGEEGFVLITGRTTIIVDKKEVTTRGLVNWLTGADDTAYTTVYGTFEFEEELYGVPTKATFVRK